MKKPCLSVMNGEVCPEFCSRNSLDSLSMRGIYYTCTNCIEYKNGNCLKEGYKYIYEFSKN